MADFYLLKEFPLFRVIKESPRKNIIYLLCFLTSVHPIHVDFFWSFHPSLWLWHLCLIYIFSCSRSPLSVFLDVSWHPECLSQSSSFCNTWFAPLSALDSQVLLLHGWTNSLGVITWEFVKNAESQGLPQTEWIRICTFTGSSVIHTIENLNHTSFKNCSSCMHSHCPWELQISTFLLWLAILLGFQIIN